jgi:type I restriction enzyme, S subunit
MIDQNSTIPKGWKMTTLGEVLSIKNGKSRPEDGEKYPVYGGNGVLGYADEYNIAEKIIIVGRVGAYCGSIFLEKEKFWLSDNALGVLSKENSNIDFLYYLLKKINLNKQAIGGAQPLLTQGVINQIEVLVSKDKEEQRAIAAVLSSLDDKIELLCEQNKTLEATAQTIFKEWFVNFNFPGANGKMIDSELGKIPEGWRVGKIKDVVLENRRGIVPLYSEKGVAVINQRCIRNGTITEEAIQFHDNTIKEAPAWSYLQPKDVLINSMGVGTLGRIAQVFIKRDKRYLIHSCVTILRANNEIIEPIIFGYIIKFLESKIESMGTGTTGQTSLNNNLLGELQIIIPNKLVQDRIAPILNRITTKIDLNYSQIQTLSAIRDVLLPKLMRGEVRVKGFKD